MATVARGTGTVDVVRFRSTAVRFVRVRIISGGTAVTMANPNGPGTVTGTELPMLDELTVTS